jgi:hypothetical protein
MNMGIVRVVSLCWLALLSGFIAGVFVYGVQIWPYPIIADITEFIKGHDEEQTSVSEKVKNDLDIEPSRHLIIYSKKDEFVENQDAREIKGLPIKSRRKNPRMFLSEKAPKGYRAIYGPLDLMGSRHGAMLINPEGNVVNVWQTSQEDVAWQHRPDTNVYPHGFEIAPDGSIVTAYDGGSSLTKYDYCGNKAWIIMGGFHHSIEFDGNGALWTWGDLGSKGRPSTFGRHLMKIDYETGEVLKMFSIAEIMLANPDIDIFGILQDVSIKGARWIRQNEGVFWHANDIEALPVKLKQYYPGFNAGDLLVSLRAPDLVFVVDPDTLKVKWWRQGLTRRQHDPDWNNRGTITIFNNNLHRGFSSIVELDPITYEHKTVIDGARYNFYSSGWGKHQLLPNGGFLVTSSKQGRIFETDREGNITFEFLNVYDKETKALSISEARFLPVDFFKELPICD